MEKDSEMTRVIFKIAHYGERADDEVIAFFPGLQAKPGYIQCYAHVGQHSEAFYEFYNHSCTPCPPKKYAALKKELEGWFGYNLKIARRVTAKDRKSMWGWCHLPEGCIDYNKEKKKC